MNIRSCLRPVRVCHNNKYYDVPCGCCEACQLSKGLTWAQRLMSESRKYSNKYFFTLTYSDEFVPKAYFTENFCFHSLDLSEKLGVNKFVRLNDALMASDFAVNAYEQGFFNVCSSLHVTRFIKALKTFKFLFTYFICSEYGPSTLRPHYHGILFLDDTAKQIITHSFTDVSDLLDRVWQSDYICSSTEKCSLGFIDVQPFGEKCAKYVANYCLCTSHLPVLLNAVSRPFHRASKRFDFGYFGAEVSEASKLLFDPSAKTLHLSGFDGSPSVDFLQNSIECHLFPQFSGFSVLSDADAIQVINYFAEAKSLDDLFASCRSDVSLFNPSLRDWFATYVFVKDLSFKDFDNFKRFYYRFRQIANLCKKHDIYVEDYVINRRRYELLKLSSKLSQFYEYLEKEIINNPYENNDVISLCYDMIDKSYVNFSVFDVPLVPCDIQDSYIYRNFELQQKYIYENSKKTKKVNSFLSKHSRHNKRVRYNL